jgi:hypothetical protein
MPLNALSAGITSKLKNQLGSCRVSVKLWASLAVLLLPCVGIAGEAQESVLNTESQKQVIQLLETVIQDYWNGGDDRSTGRAGSSTNVEAAFRKASKLMPDRLDLRFGLASSLLAQAIQTNGQRLDMKVREALSVYQDIAALDTNSFEAPILYAAYARAIGETNATGAAINELMAVHAQRTSDYLKKFSQADSILQLAPNEKPRRTMPKDKHHAIVVLGAGLETNGTMKAKLVSRLGQCLKLARIYPRAPIILTGGNQKGGVTEAYAMGLWCLQKGISRKRLFLEDRAKDTVENALFSSAILQRLGITHVTLVTSANHIHRGLADLQEACSRRGLKLEFDHLAARAKGDSELDKEQERVGVYRDLMRTSGLWAFPGLQR